MGERLKGAVVKERKVSKYCSRNSLESMEQKMRHSKLNVNTLNIYAALALHRQNATVPTNSNVNICVPSSDTFSQHALTLSYFIELII